MAEVPSAETFTGRVSIAPVFLHPGPLKYCRDILFQTSCRAGFISINQLGRELDMKKIPVVLFFATLDSTQAYSADSGWYTGDERCPPPRDDGTYPAPYEAQDYPHDDTQGDGIIHTIVELL
jgi:hypothetical protein